MSHTLVSTTRPSRSPGRITCEVLGFKVQVVKLVDVADIHLFLVQLRLIKVLGEKVQVWRVAQIPAFCSADVS